MAAPEVAAPKPGSVDDIIGTINKNAEAAKPKITADTPWSEVASQGIRNAPRDAYRTAGDVVSGVYNMVRHPIDTAQGIGKLGQGVVDYFQDEATPESAAVRKLGKQMVHDYGTEEGWKQGFAERPVSRLLDVGSVTAGPAGMLAKGAEAANLGRTANVIRKVQGATDPGVWADKTLREGTWKADTMLNNFAGDALTHTGGESLNLLRDAGYRGNWGDIKAAWSGLMGTGDPADAVKGFQTAVDDFRVARNDAYRNGKVNGWQQDRQRLAPRPVLDALDEIERRFGNPTNIHPSKPSQVNLDTADVRAKLRSAVLDHFVGGVWHRSNRHFTPEGFDDLKHNIDAILDTTESGTQSHAAASIVREAIDKELKTNSPAYARAMDDYWKSSQALKAYKKELSLGKEGSPDTALRKLFSALRDNVTANYGRRRKLVNDLADFSPDARRSLYNIAGQANKPLFPRGLVGAFKTGAAPFAAATGVVSPSVIPLAALSMPRAMGLGNLAGGIMGRALGKIPYRPLAYAGQWGSHLGPYMLPGDEE